MTNIKTYDPIFGNLADFVGSKWFNFAGNQPDAFPMDIIERPDEYEIRVVVPGANKEGIAVEVEGDVLHINVIGNNNNSEDTKYIYKGLQPFTYKRQISSLAKYNIVIDNIKSTYKSGILSIIMPRAEEARPKSISVQVE